MSDARRCQELGQKLFVSDVGLRVVLDLYPEDADGKRALLTGEPPTMEVAELYVTRNHGNAPEKQRLERRFGRAPHTGERPRPIDGFLHNPGKATALAALAQALDDELRARG